MEEKKTNKKIGVNTSSGVDKVNRIEEETPKKRSSATKSSAKTTAAKKRTNQAKTQAAAKQSVSQKVREENAKAEVRLQRAKARAERQENRKILREQKMQALKERRLQAKNRMAEKRLQARERALERRAARAARRDMLKNETAVQRIERQERERQERIALRKQNATLRHELALKRKEERMHKRQLAAESRKHKREQATKRREKRTPGIGGWLAAVISLGAASLAMLTIITVGGINMNNMSLTMGDGYRSSLYEMTELSENLNFNLNKLRVANGVGEQRKLLVDILVQSELMEGVMERFPVDMATTNNINSFVNEVSSYATKGLNKVAAGNPLSEQEEQKFEQMYNTNAKILKELQNLRNTMTDKDWLQLVKDAKDNVMQSGFEKLNTGMSQIASSQAATVNANAGKVKAKGLSGEKEISVAQAEMLAKKYFVDYDIKSVNYTGDATAEGLNCFNFTLTDARGREMYAQLSKVGGKLVMFDSYESCKANNFSQQQCVQIAQEFLTSLGMKNMKAVWLQENGTTANIHFAYEQNGVICYADKAIVKVCETKGKVVGMEALSYYLNHSQRSIEQPALSEEDAMQSLGKLKPATGRLALILNDGKEILTYEFTGKYGENEYFAYIDAHTGEEIEMFTVMNTKQGRLLR